jgi:hypothetical protein
MNIIYFLFIFIFTIVIAYIFGLSLVNLIDNRLAKFKENSKSENFLNLKDEIINYSTVNSEEDKSEIIKNNNEEKNNDQKISEQKNYNFDNDFYNQMNIDSRVNGFSKEEEYKKWDIEKKAVQTCIKYHEHQKDGRNTTCTYGYTNYSDPRDMSSVDLNIFMLNYPPNMTLQDYINWLYTFKDKEDQLTYIHLKNLRKLENGIELVQEEGVLPPPSYNYPPMNSEDYFNKLYNASHEFNIAGPLNSQTGPMMGYNYGQYSEFSQNLDVYGTSSKIRNTDIAKKKNAKELRDFVFPKNQNNIAIDKEYENYHIKDVEV